MDFFAHQDRARASTRKLIVVYILCLLGVVVTLNVIAFFIFNIAQSSQQTQTPDGPVRRDTATLSRNDLAMNLPVFGMTTVSVLSIVGLATLFKQMQLGGDGAKVAELLGGRPITAAPSDPDERKLLNIVEEMSLASGVPMPRVYLMDNESAINAFAAGKRAEAAVIGVTRGCIEKLNRDELQGVIAHEFSHILNGDMRLNIRLIAMNFGLMAIGYIGLQILRFTPRSSSRNDKNGGAAAILILAFAMMVIGYVGTLFGSILQAAVSRQREYLADASAVQFTRNPSGIAGALKKIGGFADGSQLRSAHAGEMSHMFFASGVSGFLSSLFATHPPLDQRIRAIEPNFDGKMVASGSIPRVSDAAVAGVSGFNAPPPLPRAGQRVVASPTQIANDIGSIEPEKIVHAETTLKAIPAIIEERARDPYDARGIAIALLLDVDESLRGNQLRAAAAVDEYAAQLAAQCYPTIAALGPAARLPILDLCLPALHHLSPTQLKSFRTLCQGLAESDRRISSFEIALFKIIDHQLLSQRRYDDIVAFRSVNAVADQARIALSVLARAGGEAQATQAFAAGVDRLKLNRAVTLAAPEESMQFNQALGALRSASPGVQQRVLDACAHCVSADGTVRIEEMELMRAISAALSVPMPPFLTVASR